jgi:hypothetical protein
VHSTSPQDYDASFSAQTSLEVEIAKARDKRSMVIHEKDEMDGEAVL